MTLEPQTPQYQALYCVNHPQRETLLRCNRCNNPICFECAVLTPTGYRCKDCIRGQQKVFDTAVPVDFIWAALIAVILGFLGSYIPQVMRFFTIFIAPIVGMIITEAVRAAVHRRRSKALTYATSAAALIGSLPLLVVLVISSLLRMNGAVTALPLELLLWQAVYSGLLTASVYYRMSGLQL